MDISDGGDVSDGGSEDALPLRARLRSELHHLHHLHHLAPKNILYAGLSVSSA